MAAVIGRQVQASSFSFSVMITPAQIRRALLAADRSRDIPHWSRTAPTIETLFCIWSARAVLSSHHAAFLLHVDIRGSPYF